MIVPYLPRMCACLWHRERPQPNSLLRKRSGLQIRTTPLTSAIHTYAYYVVVICFRQNYPPSKGTLCKSLKIAYTPVDKYVVTLFMEVPSECFVSRLFGLYTSRKALITLSFHRLVVLLVYLVYLYFPEVVTACAGDGNWVELHP
jgi:hypothetical protein